MLSDLSVQTLTMLEALQEKGVVVALVVAAGLVEEEVVEASLLCFY